MSKDELDEKIRAISDRYWPADPKASTPGIPLLEDAIRDIVVESCAQIAHQHFEEAMRDNGSSNDDGDKGRAFAAAKIKNQILALK